MLCQPSAWHFPFCIFDTQICTIYFLFHVLKYCLGVMKSGDCNAETITTLILLTAVTIVYRVRVQTNIDRNDICWLSVHLCFCQKCTIPGHGTNSDVVFGGTWLGDKLAIYAMIGVWFELLNIRSHVSHIDASNKWTFAIQICILPCQIIIRTNGTLYASNVWHPHGMIFNRTTIQMKIFQSTFIVICPFITTHIVEII